MNKDKGVLIPLLAIGVVLYIGYGTFEWEGGVKIDEVKETVSAIEGSDKDEDVSKSPTWTIFQNYIEFARTHNLAGIRSLSYQISEICNDPTREAECFALMDSVYNIAITFKESDFKYIMADRRQIIMYTDGPAVVSLFFVIDETLATKVLGMKVCLEDEATVGTCVETDPAKRDIDLDGWWDSVESLFYK